MKNQSTDAPGACNSLGREVSSTPQSTQNRSYLLRPVKIAGSSSLPHVRAWSRGRHRGRGSMEHQRREPTPETEVTLREFTEADAEALFSWASDPRVVLFQRREAYAHVDEARRYILDHVLPHPWYRAICLGAGAVAVGSISVKPCGPAAEGGSRASLGYRVAHGHWGRGIATRAVRMAAAAAFAAWPGLLRLEAVADVENPASQRVLEKAGFVREGVLRRYVLLKGAPRDMVMFSLVVDSDSDREGYDQLPRAPKSQVTEPFESNKEGRRGAMDPDGDARHQRRRRQEEEDPASAVSLRPLGLADVDDFMAWASDERVMRPLKRPLCATREQAVAQIRDTVLGHPWFRAVCVAGRSVGQVSVWSYPDDGGHRANLGYALAHRHWGRGIASAAIRMVVGRVFEELPGLGRLEAVTDVGNARSQRALEKAGFQREGVLRSYIVRPGAGAGAGEAGDAAVYSFLSSDPRPRPPLA